MAIETELPMRVTTIVRNDDFIVRDHEVHGVRVMPGVTFLDMTYRALARWLEPSEVELHRVLFREPLVTSESFDREVVLEFENEGSERALATLTAKSRALSRDGSQGAWQENFSCVLVKSKQASSSTIDWQDRSTAMGAPDDLDRAYACARVRRIEHGEFMKGLGTVYRDADTLLAKIELSPLAARHEPSFYIHPTYLDSSTLVPSLVSTESSDGSTDAYIPVFIERFRMLGPVRGGCWVHVPLASLSSSTGELLSGDHQIYSLDGELSAEFSRLTYKRIRNEGLIQQRLNLQLVTDVAPVHGAPNKSERVSVDSRAPGPVSVAQDCTAVVLKLLKGVLGDETADLELNAGFFDLGLDSTQLLEIASALEARVGSELYPTLLFEHNTVSKLADYLGRTYPGCWGVEDVASVASHEEEGPVEEIWVRPGFRRAAPSAALTEGSKERRTWIVGDAAAQQAQRQLAALGQSVEWIQSRPRSGEIAEQAVASLDPAAHWRRILESHVRAGSLPKVVVFMEGTPLALNGAGETALDALLEVHGWLQAWLSVAPNTGLHMVYAMAGERPDAFGLLSYLRSAAGECAGLSARVVVMEGALASSARYEGLAEELTGDGVELVRSAATGRQQWALNDVNVPEEEVAPEPGQVHVVTGGAGGLGALTAHWLASQGAGALVLCGRKPEDATITAQLGTLRALGCEAIYLSADISRQEDVNRVCDLTRQQFGRIDGVFHAAGCLRDGLIANKLRSDMEAVLAPKVRGVATLDAATANDTLSWFVVFSSLSGLTGNVGQADYAYANAYADALVRKRAELVARSQRHGRSLTVNWPLWLEGGMKVSAATRASLRRRHGAGALPANQGMKALARALSAGTTQLGLFVGDAARLREVLSLKAQQDEVTPIVSEMFVDGSAGMQARAMDELADDIAVVGLSGRYPGADNVEQLWKRLVKGDDCISWHDAKAFERRGQVAAEPAPGDEGYWAGLIDHADCFDARFFRLSPREAEFMDPQERVFLECAHAAIEDAGYCPSELCKVPVGVFTGVMWSQYQLLGAPEGAPLGASFASISNRVSYTFGFTGPSIALDSMCSSALTALHLGSEAIRRGECEVALVGGVNLMPSPIKFRQLRAAHMLSSNGRCMSFGADGDGYVPAEGVGCVLLKPLSRALEDRDHIYGIIRGGALNHGGRTAGFSVPDPAAQSTVVGRALARAGIRPEEVSYVEAHGTGTSLGDPIEIDGLYKAFGAKRTRPCAVGSIKSNIGHAESVAGIAALTKVLLQMRERTLVPSIHAERLNPSIDFARAGFVVQRELQEWTVPETPSYLQEGMRGPRVAGISSFGAGGSNAHLIVQDVFPPWRRPLTNHGKLLICLSARTKPQLRQRAQDLVTHLRQHGQRLRIDDIAFTLQHGRESFRERLGVLVRNGEELVAALERYLEDESSPGLIVATAGNGGLRVPLLSTRSPLEQAAAAWATASSVTLADIQDLPDARRVSLPTYPFGRDPYWFQPTLPEPQPPRGVRTNDPSAVPTARAAERTEPRARSIGPAHVAVKDHVVHGKCLVPGAMMAQWLWETLGGNYPAELRELSFSRPFEVERDVKVALELDAEHSGRTPQIRVQTNGLTVACASLVQSPQVTPPASLNLSALANGCPRVLSASQLYQRATARGFTYGPALRLLSDARVGEGEALLRVTPPTQGLDHWSAIEAGLQGMLALGEDEPRERYLPQGIDHVLWYAPVEGTRFIWVRAIAAAQVELRYEIRLLDAQGNALAQLSGVTLRKTASPETRQELRLYAPSFERRALQETAEATGALWLVGGTAELADSLRSVWSSGPVTWLRPGESFRRVADAELTFQPLEEVDEQALIDWTRRMGKPSHVLVVASQLQEPVAFDALKHAALAPVVSLTRVLTGAEVDQVRGLVVREEPYPQRCDWHAPMGALLRSISQEAPQMIWSTLEHSASGAHAATLIEELVRGTEREVRRRHGVREVRTWLPVSMVPGSSKVLREDGVYLLTGGLGGVGRHVARHLARTRAAHLAIVGRSAPSQSSAALFEELRGYGSKVTYVRADLSERQDVLRVVQQVKAECGRIDGVFHSAGVLRDGLLATKSMEDFRCVITPKLLAATWLDEALASDPLDCFVLFSSLAGVFGNVGQCDYAWANAALAALARARTERVARGERRGHSVAIDWPLWADGGMRIRPEDERAMFERIGLSTLSTADAMVALELALSSAVPELAVTVGDVERLDASFASVSALSPAVEQESARGEAVGEEAPEVVAALTPRLASLIATAIRMEEALDPHEALDSYGVDSVVIMDVTTQLETHLGKLPKTLFFRYQTIDALARYFTRNHGTAVRSWLGLSSVSVSSASAASAHDIPVPTGQSTGASTNDAIAIVGMAGRYPMAKNLTEFWQNLSEGKDCISEVPQERWDCRANFAPAGGAPGTSYSKWGGFIADVDKFDALFFKVAPRDAAFMDPQERLFLQTVWETMEDAGYPRRALEGRKVGVFVGVMWGEYQFQRAAVGGGVISPSSLHASVANRVSYCFDFRGPSMAVDTMCSSSLTALHLGCESLRRGECEAAFVGGVNLSLHPSKYEILSFQKFASSEGRCRAFGEGGDGYVPGEGVGAVMLKPLSKALADGDRIYGVVRGVSLNHGGKTTGYAVPNPEAQARVIADAMKAASVSAREIGYVEAHGTGTALGDPIEIAGLAEAYQGAGCVSASCAIGSIKSNIGHLESAAGIASLTKVLLQLQHQQLVPSLHAERLNPHIDFEQTPFKVQREVSPWPRGAKKRIAAISGFGAGGSNAHVIIEEPPVRVPARSANTSDEQVVLLSARTPERLKAYAERLLSFLRAAPASADEGDLDLPALSYTSQVARDAFEERLAIVTRSLPALEQALSDYLHGQSNSEIRTGGPAGSARTTALGEALARSADTTTVADHWVQGGKVEWVQRWSSGKPTRVAFPTYPFAEEHCWIKSAKEQRPVATSEHSLPASLQVVWVIGSELSFETDLAVDTWFTSEHRVNDVPRLPAVAAIDIVHAAAARLWPFEPVALTDLSFQRPIDVNANLRVVLRLRILSQESAAFELAVEGQPVAVRGAVKRVDPTAEVTPADAPEGQSSLARDRLHTIDGAAVYEHMTALGLVHGPSFQVIRSVQGDGRSVVAKLKVCARAERAAVAVLDAGLQALAALPLTGGPALQGLPARIARVRCFASLAQAAEVLVTVRSERGFDVRIVNEAGATLASLLGVELSAPRTVMREQTTLLQTPSAQNQTSQDRPQLPSPAERCEYLAPRWSRVAEVLGSMDETRRDAAVLVVSHATDLGMGEGIAEEHASQQVYRLILDAGAHDRSSKCIRLPKHDEGAIQTALAQWRGHTFDRIYFVHDHHASPEVSAHRGSERLLSLYRTLRSCLDTGLLSANTQVLSVGFDGYQLDGKDGSDALPAAAFAFLSSLAKEQGLKVAALSLCSDELRGAVAVRALSKRVVAAKVAHDPQPLVLRDGVYWQRSFEPVSASESVYQFREAGVYVISGGASGIGLEVGKHLARRAKARVALLGRSAAGPAQRAAIDAVRNAGGQATYHAVDVGDEAALSEVMLDIEHTWGAIHGVVHAAGVRSDRDLMRLDEDTFQQVIRPKVDGTPALWRAARKHHPDFFVVFSSAVTVTAPAGQTHYAAASAFQGAFMDHVNSTWSGRARTIDWGYWGSIGGATDPALRRMFAKRGFGSIEAEEGMEAFERILAGADAQVVFVKRRDPRRAAQSAPASAPKSPSKTRAPAPEQVELACRKVTDALSRVLDIEASRIRRNTTFEELGMDSLAATEITAALAAQVGPLPATLLFEFTSVTQLAQELLRKYPEALGGSRETEPTSVRPSGDTSQVEATTPAVRTDLGMALGAVVLFDTDERLRREIQVLTGDTLPVVLVMPGAEYEHRDSHTFVVRHDNHADFERLLDDLCSAQIVPDRVAFLWPRAAEHASSSPLHPELGREPARRLASLLLAEALPRPLRMVYGFQRMPAEQLLQQLVIDQQGVHEVTTDLTDLSLQEVVPAPRNPSRAHKPSGRATQDGATQFV